MVVWVCLQVGGGDLSPAWWGGNLVTRRDFGFGDRRRGWAAWGCIFCARACWSAGLAPEPRHPCTHMGARPRARLHPPLVSPPAAVATEGPAAMYTGATAEGLAADIVAVGGIVTVADLVGARVARGMPTRERVLGLDVIAPGAPSSALVVTSALRILAGAPAARPCGARSGWQGRVLGPRGCWPAARVGGGRRVLTGGCERNWRARGSCDKRVHAGTHECAGCFRDLCGCCAWCLPTPEAGLVLGRAECMRRPRPPARARV